MIMNSLVYNKKVKRSLMIFAILLLGAFLYFNDPLSSVYTPKCWFKEFTGLSCPGCGFQRCVYAMFHGDYVSAIKYNLFLAIGIPLVIISAIDGTVRHKDKSLLDCRIASIYLFLYFVWFIVRNIFNC